MSAVVIACAAIAAPSRADVGTVPIFSPDWRFVCPPDQTTPCVTPPLREGDDCRLDLINGEDDLAARLESIDKAKKSIQIQSAIFRGDESGRYIADKLIAKKKANPGMKIQIIVDAAMNMDPRSFEMYQALKANGIQVIGTPAQLIDDVLTPHMVSFKRFHEKLWIVDGEDPDDGLLIMGGLNISNQYFHLGPGADKMWRDQDVLVRGKIVHDALASFEGNFAYLTKNESTVNVCLGYIPHSDAPYRWTSQLLHEVKKLADNGDPITEVVKAIDARDFDLNSTLEPAKCRFVENRPRFGENYIRDANFDVVLGSSREVRIENAYFVPSQDAIDTLSAAVKAGRHVTILTNSLETNDLASTTLEGRKLYMPLLKANFDPETQKNGGSIKIFEWQGRRKGEPRSEGTLHSKFIVSDQSAIVVGSFNWDARSEGLNSESALFAETVTRATRLGQTFETSDLQKSEEITWEQALQWYVDGLHEGYVKKTYHHILKDQL